MANRQNTLLEHALLGLLSQKPSSGYDLRKNFALTPMGSFSDSPGAIYPALKRLQRQGMIHGRVEKGSARRRQIFDLTDTGTTELRRWLAAPLIRDDIVSRMDEVMLRFAFSEGVLGAGAVVTFLDALQREIEVYVPELRGYLNACGHEMPLSGQLALESGIRGYETQLQWAKDALARFKQIS